jgi:hypothetical protein
MSEESNSGGNGCMWFFWCWVSPWIWAGEKDGVSGGEVGLILLWYGVLILVGWLFSRNR